MSALEDDERLLLRLMGDAFVAIRSAAWTGDAVTAAVFADLMHNAPSDLARAKRDGSSVREILAALKSDFARHGHGAWFDERLEH